MRSSNTRESHLFHPILAALLVSLWSATVCPAQVIEGDGWSVHNITRESTEIGGGSTYVGDTYDFVHQLGALIDGVFQCFSEHLSGMDDSTVTFDGLSELLDPYVDGTQPLVFEFETPSDGQVSDVGIDTSLDSGDDLFPEGFEDPDTGTPLTDICIEIGRDDTLDAAPPAVVRSASLRITGGVTIGPLDITSFFSTPWNGRLSTVLTGLAGQDIDSVQLRLETAPPDIFADGFESGDATAWR